MSSLTIPPLLEVPDADLDDLQSRLRKTRWAKPLPVPRWQAGTDGAELKRLVEYWASGYDWRTQEAAINALPSRFADIDGTSVHYLRFDGEREGALPIVLTNGWPSSFFELVELGHRLSMPSRYGGDAADAFTVIVPSLPGFTFSPQRPDQDSATHPRAVAPTHARRTRLRTLRGAWRRSRSRDHRLARSSPPRVRRRDPPPGCGLDTTRATDPN